MQMNQLKNILEALLLAADSTLSIIQLDTLFELDEDRPTRDEIRKALHEMAEDYKDRGYELKLVSSGFRLQVRQKYAQWVGRLWEEKPARYTRALLETIALIAYRQPITRGEIEEVRGVSVSSNIIKTLLEREWVKVLGHKDVPGKPALYGTTREFLDYFNLKSLDELPTLAEIRDLDDIHPELALSDDEKIKDDENIAQEGDEETNEKNEDDGMAAQNETDIDISAQVESELNTDSSDEASIQETDSVEDATENATEDVVEDMPAEMDNETSSDNESVREANQP